MKKLEIKSAHYNYLLKSFTEWLSVIGYAETTVKTIPVHVRELFHYLEQQNIQHITQVTSQRVYSFLYYVKHRTNEHGKGALSNSSINKIITALNLFAQYINQTGKHTFDFTPKRAEATNEKRTVLTKEEIKLLYEATFLHHRENPTAMGQRDRAIIAIFYGCGLRKDEGINLNITDIDLIKRKVLVRRGKGNKQRYVPIATKHLEDIKSYLAEGRNWFLTVHKAGYYNRFNIQKKDADAEAFFLSQHGTRMQCGYYGRLKQLKEKAGIEKEFALHSLRHSIATHLLQSGMDIEDIAKFLGHSSLESTQIYTHIINELNFTQHVEQV